MQTKNRYWITISTWAERWSFLKPMLASRSVKAPRLPERRNGASGSRPGEKPLRVMHFPEAVADAVAVRELVVRARVYPLDRGLGADVING
jgi:hypothetical protein